MVPFLNPAYSAKPLMPRYLGIMASVPFCWFVLTQVRVLSYHISCKKGHTPALAVFVQSLMRQTCLGSVFSHRGGGVSLELYREVEN